MGSLAMETSILFKRNLDSFLEQVSNLYSQGILVDVEFFCGPQNESVKAHRLILSMYSTLFRQWFLRDDKGEGDFKIMLPQVNKDILLYILELVYKGEVRVPVDKLVTFYKLLSELEMNDLVENRGELTPTLEDKPQDCNHHHENNILSGTSNMAANLLETQPNIPTTSNNLLASIDTTNTKESHQTEGTKSSVNDRIRSPVNDRIRSPVNDRTRSPVNDFTTSNCQEITEDCSKSKVAESTLRTSEVSKETGKTNNCQQLKCAKSKTDMIIDLREVDRFTPQPSTSKDPNSPIKINPFAEIMRSNVTRPQKKSKKKNIFNSDVNLHKKSLTLDKGKSKAMDIDKNQDENSSKGSPKQTEIQPQSRTENELFIIDSSDEERRVSNSQKRTATDSDSTDCEILVSKRPKNLRSKKDPQQERKEKYDSLLTAPNFTYKDYKPFCVVCNKHYRNLAMHLSETHKKMIRFANQKCPRCLHIFYRPLSLKCHKCRKKS